MKIYTTKAELYDRMIQTAGKHYKEESRRIANILHENITAKKPLVLDLGCGTGTHATQLIKEGFRVICGDLSREMLAIAKKKTKAECVQMDMRHFSLKNKVDAIICLYNTIFYNQNALELSSTLSSCYHSLNPEGILILQIANPAMLRKAKDVSFPWRLSKREVIIQSIFVRFPRMVHHFAFLDTESKTEESDWHEMAIFTLKTIKDSLKKSRFRAIEVKKEKATLYIVARRV